LPLVDRSGDGAGGEGVGAERVGAEGIGDRVGEGVVGRVAEAP
jgi:hypothetical protein